MKDDIDLSDEQLIEKYKNGEDVFSFILRRYLKSVYNFVSSFSNKNQDAQDITQETFIKVWKKIDKYDQNYSLRTWIFAIARNTALDWLKKKKCISFSDFENEEGDNPVIDSLTDQTSLMDELINKVDKEEKVLEIINNLPPIYKEVIILKYNYEYTFEEISKIVDNPLNTVKSRYKRALDKIKKDLID